jgi:hypothetical protein
LWDDFVLEELRDEDLNGGRYKSDDENVALVSQPKKGKFKKFARGEPTSQDGKKKDMSKVKCYACRKFGHYASQCTNKKGGTKTQPEVAVSVKAQAEEFAKKFEQTKFLLVSPWELFKSFTESDSDVHVELCMGTKHVVKGSGISPFQIESVGVLRLMNVLWVPELRSVLSGLMIEKKGFDVLFQDGLSLIKPRGSSLDTTIVFGVRESNLYRL